MTKIRAKHAASIREGIVLAKFDIKVTQTRGYASFRFLPSDPLVSKAYDHTVKRAVLKALIRVGKKIEAAVEHFDLNAGPESSDHVSHNEDSSA